MTIWVAVNDTLPNEMEDVLLFDEVEGKSLGYYFEPKSSFLREYDGLELSHVTHWMPLPEHP